MIAVGTQGKVSFLQTGDVYPRVGVIDGWRSASVVCIKLKDGSVEEVNRKSVKLIED